MTFIVKCPKCGNTQKTNPNLKSLADVSNKTKKCVYCGKSFKIHPNLNDTRILRRDK